MNSVSIWSYAYFGSNKQKFVTLFDTGSSWVWVNSRVCENCLNGLAKFDERQSNSFSFYNSVMDLHYGSGDVYGYNSYDQVCLKPDVCVDNFSFLTVSHNRGLNDLMCSSLIGLSPNTNLTTGDLFIMKMKNSGVLPNA